MTALRKALTVLAMAVLVSLGSVGVSHAEGCEWPGAAGEFYCDPA
ncbi:hypothetical protein [Streptomyces sp. NPDC058401]